MTDPTQLGKYEIRRRIGTGAMGIVYEAWDPGIGRRVAIKTLKQDLLESSEAADILARFRREAQAAGRLNHPNIVAVYELGEEDGVTFIAMEYVDGKELKDYCDHGERFPLDQAVRIVTEILAALEAAHRAGVVHRDIKPGNIFLVGSNVVKVGDFGVARLESSELTQAGSVLGTPSYMSPEQISGQVVDGRADLFSTGVILYQLLTGEKPFQGASLASIMHKLLKEEPTAPSAINVHVSPTFDAVIVKALAKRPENRYQTAAEFAAALAAANRRQTSEASERTGEHTQIVGDATISLATLPDPVAEPTLAAPRAALGSAHRRPEPAPRRPRPAVAAPVRNSAQRNGGPLGLFLIASILLIAAAAVWWWLMGMPLPTFKIGASIAMPTATAPAPETPLSPAQSPSRNAAQAAPIGLSILPTNGRDGFKAGERVVLKVTPSRNAYLYCFMQDEQRRIARFFPNRFTPDAAVSTAGIQLPKGSEFSINANRNGAQEQIVCYATEKDVLARILPAIGGGDIDRPTPLVNIAEMDQVFAAAAGATLGIGRLAIRVNE